MSPTSLVYRWIADRLELLDHCDVTDTTIVVADSWLVSDGRTLALDLHKQRFAATAGAIEDFWDAILELVPNTGDWFPRVEKHANGTLLFRLRSAPERSRSVVLATTPGDPRTHPTVKGPDLATMLRLRTEVQAAGAGEAVILSPDGYVVEGAYSALVWWRGSILCYPSEDLERIHSVTSRSLIGLATALGVDTFAESVTPAELDGTELWTLNALHGPRIATAWVDGPSLAELPGRLDLWRKRLTALAR
jgi:branched-subunit amino acid aminotransferase/4-amino-4-deoxychorismate lyase